jgi:acyl carrier protein
MRDKLRAIVEEYAGLPMSTGEISDDDDLFQAGMTSHASLSVMLAIEDNFGVEFPDEMLSRNVFASVSSIAAALETLGVPVA